ncbi:hypothetical protein SUNI508_08501 [Seiridium unicorne]|uniref:Heterokaryon incompatibility domain-containing protein n=1 Tax=Seiridium unicorne TaxID=138068 RepID=A0ABR2UTS4_9PEZI
MDFGPDRGEGRYSRKTGSSLKLSYGLNEAIAASREGCQFYEWFLDALSADLDQLSKVKFPIHRIEFQLAFESDGTINCGPIVEAVGNAGGSVRLVDKVVIGESWSRLSICAPRDDPVSRIVPHRPPETDVFSSRSIEFSKDSLTTCMRYHEQCRSEWLKADLLRMAQDRHSLNDINLPRESIALEDLPTRLLKIENVLGSANLNVSLIDVTKLSISEQTKVAASGFAALSYCWGKEGNPIQLTLQSHDELKQGIPASSLPATIHDAMRFASALGLEYTWVDALCIFQDSPQDKESEIMRMGSYYGTNTLTLCAASADGSSTGLNGAEPRCLYRVPPLRLRCSADNDIGQIILYSDLELRESITGRGWTLQESLLSRRILIFSHQLYWCCVTANAECEGAIPTLSKEPNRNLGFPESLVPGIYPAQVLRDYPPEIQWYLGVGLHEEASWCRQRQTASDLCVCFQNSHQVSLRRSPGESISYVAGLFLSRRDSCLSAQQLFWQPSKTSECTRAKTYRAPSWSWAAVDGELKLSDKDVGNSYSIQDHSVVLGNPSAPYGSVQGAALHLSGCSMRPLQDSLRFSFQVVDIADSSSDYGVSILPDTPPDGDDIANAIEGSSNTQLFLLQLSEHAVGNFYSATRPIRGKFYGCIGLVVTPVSGAASNNYRRLGSFNFYRAVHDDETEMEKSMDAFFNVPKQDIILL